MELDGVRGIAILVMIGHGWSRLSLLAVSGVSLFFVLSGFLITRILLRNIGTSYYFNNFYTRRALRIWPLYYLILLIAFLTPIFSFSHAEFPPYRFLLYIQNFRSLDKAPPIMGTTWSLAIYRLGNLPVVARLAVAVLIATASWYLFEKPILRLKDSLTRVEEVTSKVAVGA